MPKTNTIPSVQNVNNVDGRIQNADGTGKVLIWTAGANDAVLKSLGLTSTDTVDKVVLIYLNIGGASADRLIGAVSVPALSGTDGSKAAIDVMRSALIPFFSLDAYGNHVFNAKAGTTLKIAATVAVSATKEIAAIGEGGDF